MSLLVMNFRAQGLVGRLGTSSVEPKQRLACTWQVAHGSTGRSWSAGSGLISFLLMIAHREVVIRSLHHGAAQFDVLTRSPWSLSSAAGCLMGRCCGGSIGLPPGLPGESAGLLLLLARLSGESAGLLLLLVGQCCRLFGQPTGLLLLLARLLLSLFGLPTGLLLLLTDLHGGLFGPSTQLPLVSTGFHSGLLRCSCFGASDSLALTLRT